MSRDSKVFSFYVKDLGTRKDDSGQEFGQIEAYGAIFNNVDEGRDRILPGAFTRTIKNSKTRAQARGKSYLVPMLWQHDTKEVIGGWYDIEQDSTGLRAKGDIALATQRGREYYALAKAGMTDEFSIIYDVMDGGAKFDKGGVRDLSELRLFSIDPVTFAMNDSTFTVAVKAASQADQDAQEARSKKYGIAIKDGGNVTKPSKWASLSDADFGDPVNYSFPMPDKAHADNAAARFGDESTRAQYSKAEQAIIDKRIAAAQKKFGEDDDDGSKSRGRRTMQRKTFQEHYAEEQCEDLLEDWCEVVICALTSAVYDAFAIGDAPESDINDALDAFKDAVAEWVAEAQKYNLSQYLADQDSDYTPGLFRMQGGGSPYGYMSRQTPMHAKYRQAVKAMSLKAMLASDATTGGFTADHVAKLQKAAVKAMKATDDHVDTLKDAAAQVKSLIGAGSSTGEKAGRAFSAANTQALTDHADALEGAADTLSKAMTRHMKAVTSVADDLATVVQGSVPAYGTDRGNAGDEQEGKSSSSSTQRSLGRTSQDARAPRVAPSTQKDTLQEQDIEHALAALRKLRTPAA